MYEWNTSPTPDEPGIERKFVDGYGKIFITEGSRAFKAVILNGIPSKEELVEIGWRYKIPLQEETP